MWQNFQLNAKTEAAFNMIESISKRVVSREVKERCLIIFTSPTSTSTSMTRTTYSLLYVTHIWLQIGLGDLLSMTPIIERHWQHPL